MEIENFLEKIDFSTVGSSLSGLKKNEILGILQNYYLEDKSLKSIIKELNLIITPQKLKVEFPKVLSEEACPYDGCKMYTDIPSKKSLLEMNTDLFAYECTKCGHKNNKYCMCDNCVKEYKKQIVENYSDYSPVYVENISLKERITISTILKGLFAKNLKDSFGSYSQIVNDETLLFYNDKDAYKKIVDLVDKEYIKVSSDTDISAFVFDENFPNRYYPMRAKWVLNISSFLIKENDKLFNYLKFPNYSIVTNESELISIWRELVVEELYRIFKLKIKEFKFVEKNNNDTEKIYNGIKRFLEFYTPAQIYSLLWIGIRKADNARTNGTWGKYSFNHIDFILKKMDDVAKDILNKNKEVDSYQYPTQNTTPTLFTKVFFEEVALEPLWFMKKIPENKELNDAVLRGNFYSELKKREKQHFDLDISSFEYYYFTDFGVVMYDGLLEWLFTDEKTLYKIQTILSCLTNSNESCDQLQELEIPYYINETYSTTYILQLIKKLTESKLENRISKEYENFIRLMEDYWL